MSSKNPIIICGAHGGGTSIGTKVLRMNGLFAGADAGSSSGNRDAEKPEDRTLHESAAMVRINCLMLKYFLGPGDETSMVNDCTWIFYINCLKASNILNDFHRDITGDGISVSDFLYQGGLERTRDLNDFKKFTLDDALDNFWGDKERNSLPWGWKDPRNSPTIPFWKMVFEKPKFLFLERTKNEKIESSSPSGEWFRSPIGFTKLMEMLYYHPPFLEEKDDTYNINLKDMFTNVDEFNRLMKWIGLNELSDNDFKSLMNEANIKYEKL